MRETIGDVDILAAAARPATRPLMAAFTALPDVADVIASGDTKTSIRTAGGLQVDLRVVPLDAWGAALQYFTGSQAHNVRIREIAVRHEAEAVRVRPVRRRDRRADRVPDRGGGVPQARHGLDPADAARGHRRGPGRAPRRAAGPGDRRRHPRRPAHAHRPHRRRGLAGGDGGRRGGPRLRLLRGHRPRAEPGHAADDQREDARAARAGPRARRGSRPRHADDAAARHRAEHRARTGPSTGPPTSSPASTSAWPRCTRTSTSRGRR